jgi:ferredoxin
MASRFRVHLDRDECTSCGLCWETCPELFEEGPDDGYSQIVEQYRVSGKVGDGEAPGELASSANDAAGDCPVQIIHIEPL